MSRKVLAYLLIIPIALTVNYIVNPGDYWAKGSSVGEMLFLVFGLPILVVNYLVWVGDPHAND